MFANLNSVLSSQLMLIYADSHCLSVRKEDRITASDPLTYITPVDYRLRSKSTACLSHRILTQQFCKCNIACL